MPPAKSRTAPDDSRSEASSTREKLANFTGLTMNGKGRRVASGLGINTSLKDSVNSGTGPASVATGLIAQDAAIGMQWSTVESSILHTYRNAYRLITPSAFSNLYNQIILSRPGIGRLSPTMARRRDRRRQSKEQLANSVRKHFNGLGIQENEAVVDFLYKVKWQDKNFRMRFTPYRPR